MFSKTKFTILIPVVLLLLIFTGGCGGEEIETEDQLEPEKFADQQAVIQVVVDEHYLSSVQKLIRSAESTLHLTQLYINNDPTGQELIRELNNAAQRGIDIKVVLNESEDRNHWAIEWLHRMGAQVREAKRGRSGKLHSKMVIADRKRLMIGSTNWSGMSIRNTHETNLRIDHPTVADYYVRWIEHLFDDPYTDPDLEPVEVPELKTVTNRQHSEAIDQLLNEAEERIWLGIYAFRTYFGTDNEGSTSDQMAQKLVEAHKEGLDVRVILELSDYSDFMNEMNANTAQYLLDNGITVKGSPRHKTAHWKLLLVDDRAMIGSMNWGYSGFDLHAEASILVNNPRAIETLEKYYLNLWKPGEIYPVNEF
ncbi:MAG: phospholipase D-like domain-containing protein [bacterium]